MIVYNFNFIINKLYFATISQGVQSLVYVCVCVCRILVNMT